MIENNEYKNVAVYVPGFIKVLKCYESTINAYVERCKKKKIEPNEHGDDIYRAQMQVCRSMHAGWVKLNESAQPYDTDIIGAMSMAINALVYEKLEAFRIKEEVINED